MAKTRPKSLMKFHRSNYRSLGFVGRGQFGRVSCAIHRLTGQMVALKELDQQFPTHQFLRELRFLLALQHPNIVTCWACEHSATGRYLVTDYCEGGTLRQLMEQVSLLPTTIALQLVGQVLAGLEHAHHLGILHCDIKPENILLTLSPKGWTAKLSDFGIARLQTESQSPDRQFHGSPAYMAPERFYGQYSATADVYAVGVLLYELLVGDRPFTGTPGHLMSAHLTQLLHIPDRVPNTLHPILRKSLAKLQAQRYRNAGEMLIALKKVCSEEFSDDTKSFFQLTSIDSRFTMASENPATIEPAGQSLLYKWVQARLLLNPLQGIVTGNFESGFSILQWDEAEIRVETTHHPQGNWAIALQSAFSEAITAAWIHPHGINIVTAKAQYQIQQQVEQYKIQQTLQVCELHSSQQWTAIEPQGRWIATLQPEINLYRLTVDFLTRPQQMTASLSLSGSPTHLLALDARHLGILSEQPNRVGSTLAIVSRRGQWLGSLNLGFVCDRLILGHQPYQSIATELQHPQGIVMMDLKPFQVRRIALPFVPEYSVATPWGYVLCDRHGQAMALDFRGDILASLQFPAGVTAIAPLAATYLLVATWQDAQGQLLTYDLRSLLSK